MHYGWPGHCNGSGITCIQSVHACLDSLFIWLMIGWFLWNVQEARRAAEKAYDVAKVDERVNRAVAAANRAANAARVAAVKAVQKQMHHTSSKDTPLPVL